MSRKDCANFAGSTVCWEFTYVGYVHGSARRLISRNGNVFKSFPVLADSLPSELGARSAVLDGEIVSLDRHGKTQFKDLLFRRREPRFYTFYLRFDGEDLRHLPLIERKLRLRSVVPQRGVAAALLRPCGSGRRGLFRLA